MALPPNRAERYLWLTVVLVQLLATPLVPGVPVEGAEDPARDAGDSNQLKEEAVERLLELFGMNDIHPSQSQRNVPPEYMLDLYNAVADDSGLMKMTNPYGANVVRSFPDKGERNRMYFKFDLQSVPRTEKILQAELHLYKLRPKSRSARTPLERRGQRDHFYEVHLYQLLDSDKEVGSLVPDNSKLIGARLVSAHGTGWEVFSIKPAVNEWLDNTTSNLGILVTVNSINGAKINNPGIRFAKKKENHSNKQPILVIFSDDGRKKFAQHGSEAIYDYDYTYDYIMENYEAIMQGQWSKANSRSPAPSYRPANTATNKHDEDDEDEAAAESGEPRSRRAAEPTEDEDPRHGKDPERRLSEESRRKAWKVGGGKRSRNTGCQREELYVDFKEIGWSDWIIAPPGYKAYHCRGNCPFPLGHSYNPSNHATVQAIVSTVRGNKRVAMPCCVPDYLHPISLLYFDEEANVVLKQYDDMVAASCGCR